MRPMPNMTIAAAAAYFGVQPTAFRRALVEMLVMSREYDMRAKTHRHRLTPDAVGYGLGLRYDPVRRREYPVDILTQSGLDYIARHLQGALAEVRRKDQAKHAVAVAALKEWQSAQPDGFTAREAVEWLELHHRDDIASPALAEILGCSESLIRRYRREFWHGE